MKILNAVFLCICILSINSIQAETLGNMNVPFENVFMFPNHTIAANFSFGINNTIFCYENNLQTVGSITWPYKGKTQHSQLPIFLVTSASAPGSFSDPTGTLVIKNTTNITLVVSCLFGY